MKRISLLLLTILFLPLFAGAAKAEPLGTVTSSSVTTQTITPFSNLTTILTATYYYGYGFSIAPETTIITTINGTPTKTGITLYSTSFWGLGQYTYTVRTDVTTATAVIVFVYRSGNTTSVVTNVWSTTRTSATYTTSTVGEVQRTGNGTAATYIIATGSIILNTTTTIVTSTTFITSTWDVTYRIIEHSITSNYYETRTITVIILNTYGLSYESTATVIEILTKITSESIVPYEIVYDQFVTNSNTYINYTLQTFSKETYYTTILTIVENGVTYSLTFGNFGGLTELVETTYNKTLHETTVTTTFIGYIDAEAGVVFDAYVDSQYYSTSIITVIYHDIQSFVTTTITSETSTTVTTTILPTTCCVCCYEFRIRWRWMWHHGCGGFLYIWFNDWYIELYL